MPNLVMEYSNSADERINIQGLLEDLHQATMNSGLFESSSVKSRALRYHTWLIGDAEDEADFIHIRFELLSGRTSEQKRQLTRSLMEVLVQKTTDVHSLTIDVRDMDTDCFQKVLN